ncbi:flagellar biosynthesis regulator FlaF [Haematospirillum sp. 15-248]|uniref:flagellar biosynthesis regulator FlaF n=1 Tax=Haematospirillum sp. 15-248 TaxID=2723107 RepID=UPI0014396971|nr:flagellar biosynthesis regulator FlaF [Haematospirillum sp. 15-248]NKD87942.1 flagellar biosynthesis regulator FlaF [Haematospirillum sp. 15-248]
MIQPGDPRKTEAWALMQAAVRMKLAQDSDDFDQMRTALRLNWRLWTILQSDLLEPDCPVPPELRANMLSLSNFVDRQAVAFMANPDARLLDTLISINREISAGLSTTDESGSASGDTPEAAVPSGHNVQT